MVGLGLAAILLLILANGWFVAGEFAYVAASRGRLEAAEAAGDRAAGRALAVMSRLSFALSGAQLGITVTSLAVGYLAAPVFPPLLRPALDAIGVPEAATTSLGVSIGLIVSTALQMVVGELAPTNLAIARPEPVGRRLAGGQLLSLRLFGPVITLFDRAANGLLRAVGIEPVEELSEAVTAEELGHIISSSAEEGTLQPTLGALLSRSLDFRSLRVADALVPRTRVVAIAEGATCAELQELARETGHSRFPVTGPGGLDDVVGVVQLKDLLGVPAAERPVTPVRTLVEPELAVPESQPLPDLLHVLRDQRTQMAVVVDEFGGTAGIITLEDLVEELVGDIRDEHDVGEPRVVALGDGRWQVPGGWRIDEVERDTGLTLPEGEHDTLGGLVMSQLGRVPEAGDEIVIGDLCLRVLAVEGHAASLIEVERGAPPRQAEAGA